MNRRSFLASVTAMTCGCVGGGSPSCEQLGGIDEVGVGSPVDRVADPSGRWPAPYGPFNGTRSIRESGRYTGTVRRAWRREIDQTVGGEGSRVLEDLGLVLAGETLYGVTEIDYEDRQLVAVDPADGSVLWRDNTVDISGAVVAGEDLLYLRDEGTLVAFDPDERTVVWRVQFGLRRSVSIPVVNGDHVFVHVTGGDGDGRLYSLRDGERAWNTPASTAPVIANERLYVVDGKSLKALDAGTGRPLWTTPLEDAWLDRLAARGGQVYLTGSGVTAVDAASGERLWSHAAPPGRTRRATVGAGRVYVPTRQLDASSPRLYTYTPAGDEPVSCGRLSPFNLSGPVLTTDDLVVYPGAIETGSESVTTFLQARRPNGTVEWRVTWSPGGVGSVSLCAGQEALFFFNGETLEAFVFD